VLFPGGARAGGRRGACPELGRSRTDPVALVFRDVGAFSKQRQLDYCHNRAAVGMPQKEAGGTL